MKISKLKGTQDFFESSSKSFNFIEQTARKTCEEYGVKEVITPIIEATEVFSRGVGEATDVVTKEMYTFLDRSEKSITLRPEGTAGVMRSYVENKMYATPGLTRLFYIGPMFRAERPQAGRFRQFHQFGVEILSNNQDGSNKNFGNALIDADTIAMAVDFLKALHISNIKVYINTLGSDASRLRYVNVLKEYFKKHLDVLCEDCKNRLEKNPLRILDCKVDSELDVIKNAPKIQDFLDDQDKSYFKQVLSAMDALNISYEIDDSLVRGLDYYNQTVFEIKYFDENSSINTLALGGGGRYNDLSLKFDGPSTSAFGFAFGLERLMVLLEERKLNPIESFVSEVTIITLGDNCKIPGLTLMHFLRRHGYSCQMDYDAINLKPQFKLADRLKSKYILILGDDEVSNQTIKIKDTINRTEEVVELKDLNKYFNIEGENYVYHENKK